MREGLTWYTDKYIKFRNPKTDNLTLAEVFEGKEGIFFFLSSEIILCHVLNVFPHRNSATSILAEARVQARSFESHEQWFYQ